MDTQVNLGGKKILVFDGIGGNPLGRVLTEEFARAGLEAVHVDGQQLTKKRLYSCRSGLTKAVKRLRDKESYFYLPKARDRAVKSVISEQKPHIVLVIGFLYRFVSLQTIKALKQQLGFSLYLYDTDSCNFYHRRREFIFFLNAELTVYDHIFSFSKVTTEFFIKTRGLNTSWLPFGASPIPTEPRPAPRNDVLFVGSADLRRIFLLEKIASKVRVCGSRWQRNFELISPALKRSIQPQSVWGDELHALLHDSKIVLNITRSDFFGAETGVNLRVFEALAAGAFLLTDYCDELNELFKIGHEIEVFRSSQELTEKVDYYLTHEAARLKIASQGHQRYLQDFTWQARVTEILRQMSQNQKLTKRQPMAAASPIPADELLDSLVHQPRQAMHR